MKVPGVITLTSDFGLTDPYVGVMKGVILSINPKAHVIDISHQIEAGSIFQGSVILKEAYAFFPDGSIHIAVIDPGVGGNRRPIILKTKNHLFVGPDNGIFWPIILSHQGAEIIHLTETKYFLPNVSHTFHGRDIFAPVAAHLSRGVDPPSMGPIITDPVSLEFPLPKQGKDVLSGQVIRVDHFGNLITNIHQRDIEEFLGSNRTVIRIGNLIIQGMQKAYAEAREGQSLALIGSSGFLEIAVNASRACDVVGLPSKDLLGLECEVSKIEYSEIEGTLG